MFIIHFPHPITFFYGPSSSIFLLQQHISIYWNKINQATLQSMIPAKVVKMVTRIQREFLWGGVKGGRKICWVKWRKICQPRGKGGLGVRDVRLMNWSLLAK